MAAGLVPSLAHREVVLLDAIRSVETEMPRDGRTLAPRQLRWLGPMV